MQLPKLAASRWWALAAVLAVLVIALLGSRLFTTPTADEGPQIIPAPLRDETASGATPTETVVLAGGCFWGVQGVFEHVKGVVSAVSGYTGGDADTAHYEIVSMGSTGHAESVRVTFDPRQISYGRILQIYFSVVHDPTELNYQGPDVGTQYRSTIFPMTDEQAQIAKAYIAQLNQARVFNAAIVTTIEPGKTFYPAEDYHQDYLANNQTPYIIFNDLPKIANLKQDFPKIYRDDPVLVASAHS